MKRRTKKRLAVVVLVAIALPLLGLGASVLVAARRDRLLNEARAEGMAAYADGDMRAALQRLGYVVGRRKTDGEALLAYADASAQLPEPNDRHISRAIAANRLAADALPGDVRPHRNLVRLYQQRGFLDETISAANLVLDADPDDLDALRAKARALFLRGEVTDCQTVLMAILQIDPVDPLALNLAVDSRREINEDPAEIERWLESHAEANGDNIDVLLALARLQYLTGQRDLAQATLRKAAGQSLTDDAQLRRLLTALDALDLASESERLLQQGQGPELALVAIERTWKQGRYTEARRRADEAMQSGAEPSPQLVGLAALVRTLSGASDPDAEVAAAMQAAPRSWGPLVQAARRLVVDGEPREAKDQLVALAATLPRGPEYDHARATIVHLTAAADAAMGNNVDAIAGWRTLLESDPGWVVSSVSLVNALMEEGRAEDAYTVSLALIRHASQNPFAVRAYLYATGQLLAQGAALPETRDENLRAAVSQIREIVGGEGDLLCVVGQIHVALGDVDEARSLLPDLRTAASPPTAASLIRFAETARPVDTALAADILGLAAESDPNGPLIVLSNAIEAARDGRPEDGVRLIDEAIAAASGDARTELERARARFLRSVDQRRALEATRQLAERDSADPAAQIDLLNLPLAWTDCALIENTLRRLGAAIGQDSSTWRTYEARRLLACAGGQADASSALLLLVPIIQADPLAVEPRLLAAEANVLLNDRPVAISTLTEYVNQGGRDIRAHIRLASLLEVAGRNADSRAVIERATRIEPIPADARLQRALAAQRVGLLEAAKADLKAAAADGVSGADRAIVEFAVGQNDLPFAADAVARLQALSVKDAAACEALTAYYAADGRMDEALALLEGADLDDDERALIAARAFMRHDRRDEAESILRERADAPGSSAEIWTTLIGSRIEVQDYEQAKSLIAEALKRHPDDSAVRAQQGAVDLATGTADPAAALAAINAALSEQNADPALVELGQILERFVSEKINRDQYIDELDSLTTRYPTAFSGWSALIDACLQAGRVADATAAADAMAVSMPRNPRSLQLAIGTLASARQFQDAIRWTEAWRRLPGADPLLPDLTLAELQGLVGRPSEGLAIAERHRDRILDSDDPRLIATYAGLLAAVGRDDEADAILRPLAEQDAAWARRYIEIASAITLDLDARRAWLERAGALASRHGGLELPLGDAWRTLAQRTGTAGDYNRAAELLTAAQAVVAPTPALHIMIAECQSEAGRKDEAEASFRRALALAEDPIALNNLAALIADQRPDDPEAVRLATRAVEIARAARVPGESLAPFLDTLGFAQLRAGRAAPAIESFREAVRLAPSQADSIVGLAEAYLALGDRTAAASALQQARALPSLPKPLADRANLVERSLSGSSAAP